MSLSPYFRRGKQSEQKTLQKTNQARFAARAKRTGQTKVGRSNIRTCRGIISKIKGLEWQTDGKVAICDGCVLTPIAHLLAYERQNDANTLLKEVKAYLSTYAHFFLLDIHEVPYELDDIRNEDIEFRAALQRAFRQLLRELQLPYSVVQGTPLVRKHTIEEYLKSLGHPV